MHFTNCEGVCFVRVLMLVAGFKVPNDAVLVALPRESAWTCPVIQRIGSPLTVKIMHGSSRLPAGFRSRLSRGWWLSPSCCGRFCRFGCDRFSRLRRGRLSRFGYGRFSRFGHGFSRSPQFRLGRFRSAMVAMLQRLDARSFFLRPQLSVCTVSALVLEVFRNRFSCHGGSVAEPPVRAVQFWPLGDNS